MHITFSIFPKFYNHLSVPELAALVREVGLDTTNAIIRDGYWVTRAGLATELPAFIKAMRVEGLEIHFATAGFSADEVIADATPLAVLADNGITEFRMGYFQVEDDDPRTAFASARAKLGQMVPLCERYGVRAVYQVHHGTLIPSASAVWHLVDGLPARWIGVELDPGNQSYEGFEDWGRSAWLLGEYLVAVGVKDTALVRDAASSDAPDKGWRRSWVPVDEGVTNWFDVVGALSAVDFTGTFVFMPFYDEDDPATMTRKLKREAEYLRTIVPSSRTDG